MPGLVVIQTGYVLVAACNGEVFMKRYLAIFLLLVVAGYGFEKVSGHGIGVSRTLGWAKAGATATIPGGYGIAASVSQGVHGGMTALAAMLR